MATSLNRKQKSQQKLDNFLMALSNLCTEHKATIEGWVDISGYEIPIRSAVEPGTVRVEEQE